MAVSVDPQELSFKRPFTTEVAQILKIGNPTDQPLVFKVKTTAPKQYCVRPNSGRVEAGREVTVVVLLQAMKQDPPLEQKCRDKFLVQSVTVTEEMENTNIPTIWEMVDKSAIQEKKIRVAWSPPSENSAGAILAPLPVARTPVRDRLLPVNGGDATPENPAYHSPVNNGTCHPPSPPPEPVKPATQSDESAKSAPSVPSPKPEKDSATEDLRLQLAQARTTIASLQEQVSSGLKQRKVEVAATLNEKAPQVAQLAQRVDQGTGGVPIHVVAALCFFCFLLAYLFF